MLNSQNPPIVVKIIRGALVESYHFVSACVVDSDGQVCFKRGDIESNRFFRSSMKPLQAAAMVACGAAEHFKLTLKEIAICAGSHGGEDIHIAAVRSILNKIGLNEGYFQCGVQPPLDPQANRALLLSSEEPQSIHHNCSGKHSGMLATAVHMGYDVNDYCNPDSKLQHYITDFIAQVASLKSDDISIGIDGCSAPVHGIPLYSGALAFARLIKPTGISEQIGKALCVVADAMRRYPEYIASRQGRICTELMRSGEEVRLTAKSGAEGVYAAAWIDHDSGKGFGLAVKVEDGAQRARDPVVITLLQKFKALPQDLPKSLIPFAPGFLTNWANKIVGKVEVNLNNGNEEK